jgi:hypothetical protein
MVVLLLDDVLSTDADSGICLGGAKMFPAASTLALVVVTGISEPMAELLGDDDDDDDTDTTGDVTVVSLLVDVVDWTGNQVSNGGSWSTNTLVISSLTVTPKDDDGSLGLMIIISVESKTCVLVYGDGAVIGFVDKTVRLLVFFFWVGWIVLTVERVSWSCIVFPVKIEVDISVRTEEFGATLVFGEEE